MDTFNTFLLTTFAPNEKFTNQIDSLRRRLQTLSLVYMTWVFIVLISLFGMIMEFMLHHESSLTLLLPTLPPLLLNLFLIRSKKLDAAALVLVLIIHFSNKLAGTLLYFPLVSVLGTLIYPYFIFFATSSLKILVLNAFLCCGQFFYNSAKVYEIFQETIDQEQYRQIHSLIGICFFVVISDCLISIIQKNLETHIWAVAQENYQKTEQLTQEVVKAMEAKDTFISSISHEIRNPLNSLKGSVDYLAQVIKNQDQLMILRNAKLSGEILLNLVNNILDAAKLNSDKMDIACMDSNLGEIIEKALNINSQALKDKNIFAQAFIDETLPRAIWLDPCRILQILMNLMSNALKFTPCNGKIKIYASWCSSPQTKTSLLAPINTGGHHYKLEALSGRQISDSATRDLFSNNLNDETLEMSPLEESNFTKKLESISKYKVRPSSGGNSHDISFFDPQAETETEPWKIGIIPFRKYFPCPQPPSSSEKPIQEYQNFIKIQIQDTGCGIAEKDAKKLFGMFEQAAQHSRSVQGGSGLGLWICKQLCRKMNGDITVYSEPKKGSSFVLYIPINNLIEIHHSFDNRDQGSQTQKKSLRALVVDDFSTNIYAHRLLLEQHNVRVTVASGGQEAVDRYKAQGNDPYHLILMDASMPEMDGFTAARLIREWEIKNSQKKAALCFVTGEYLDEAEVVQEFKRLGNSTQGVNCVRKPLTAETVHQIILSLQ